VSARAARFSPVPDQGQLEMSTDKEGINRKVAATNSQYGKDHRASAGRKIGGFT